LTIGAATGDASGHLPRMASTAPKTAVAKIKERDTVPSGGSIKLKIKVATLATHTMPPINRSASVRFLVFKQAVAISAGNKLVTTRKPQVKGGVPSDNKTPEIPNRATA
jgi:hypothetical protein